MLRRWLLLAALLLASVISAPALSADAENAPAIAVSSVPNPDEYILGAGDKLRLNVFDEPTLSGEFVVSGSGVVSLPLIGDVRAAGLTVKAFQMGVVRALSEGYLKEPRVSAEVLNFRPFYILGEVSKPGEYPYNNGMTVLKAVATAGGYTYRANTKKVVIKRVNESEEHEFPLTTSTPVLPGDTIRIKERFF